MRLIITRKVSFYLAKLLVREEQPLLLIYTAQVENSRFYFKRNLKEKKN